MIGGVFEAVHAGVGQKMAQVVAAATPPAAWRRRDALMPKI